MIVVVVVIVAVCVTFVSADCIVQFSVLGIVQPQLVPVVSP